MGAACGDAQVGGWLWPRCGFSPEGWVWTATLSAPRLAGALSPCPEQVYPGQASLAWAGHLSSVIVTAGLPFWPLSCSYSYAGSLWLKDYDSE